MQAIKTEKQTKVIWLQTILLYTNSLLSGWLIKVGAKI